MNQQAAANKVVMTDTRISNDKFNILFVLVGGGRRDFVEVRCFRSSDDITIWSVTAYDNPLRERWLSREKCFQDCREFASPLELLKHIGVDLIDVRFFDFVEQLKATGTSQFCFEQHVRTKQTTAA